MNYCKKKGKHWKCIANSAKSQRRCDYFTPKNNQFCANDKDGICTHVLARSFATQGADREQS